MKAALEELVSALNSAKDIVELHAQLQTAFWAKWAAIASLAGVIVSVGAIALAFMSIRLARHANALTREMGQMQNQAYIHATKAEFGRYGNVLIYLKNSGLTPATHFAVNATAKIVPHGTVSASISFRSDNFKIWSAIGAGDEISVSILEGDEQTNAYATRPEDNEVLLISGQITYCSIFNEDHLTQFAFFVDKKYSGSTRFRRPTANLITFHKTKPNASKPVDTNVLLDDNEPANNR
ncbi:hypothetical protein HJA89_27830 [Rhizobium bangladeshense]|uniref:hypothetical protein n=1 Tax=Rhizobium TaxID=379 RepID=UPI001C82931C|nr:MULTISPECIES: hypothetical protein [Rhizobium]MBX4876651.1 hypothetical protein [Rhizobium bangladeshense]MBX4887569.1 hypothetical protein [Rhizobium bangladeshense]MBX5146374.1 hypothetical protein [Rhizobium lentis]